MGEHNLDNQNILAATSVGGRLFRINTGLGWIGNQSQRVAAPTQVTIYPGDVLIRRARPLHAGFTGCADLLGWMPRNIGGIKIAQFVACEDKTESGRLSQEQLNFLATVQASGGVSVCARSTNDLINALKGN